MKQTISSKDKPFRTMREIYANGHFDVLRMALKEALQQCPEETAKKLASGYMEGKTIVLYLGQNSWDPVGNKTAGRFALTPNQSWRGLPVTSGEIN